MSKNLSDFCKAFAVTRGRRFRLRDIDPDRTLGLRSKEEAAEWLQKGISRLSELQELLYAQDRWGLLVIFQAMDAAGKDGAIKHVLSGINPQGCQVFSFKAPSSEDLDHDFMWRTSRCLPERGRIGVFNRSYYEEVLVVRVHPELLNGQRLPPALVSKRIWDERFEDINAFERYLARNGIAIVKIFLHISRAEQRKRFLARLEEPEKHWKFSLGDVQERERWNDYMKAYEELVRETAHDHAPWYVVPANAKWFARVVVVAAIVEALEKLDLQFPRVDRGKVRELAAARAALMREGRPKRRS
jgi:PPK2 family polyphosphate:nucleotide phosphotransferase